MTFKAYLATAFCLVALFSTASANPITLSFSGSLDCQRSDPQCGTVFGFDPAWSPGAVTSGSGTISQVIGPHGESTQVSGGSLLFSTAPSYNAQVYWLSPVSIDAWGDSGSGGSFSISGSLPGLASGMLLSGTFLSASWDMYYIAGGDGWLASAVRTSYVNPVLLEDFGIQPNLSFTGHLSGGYHDISDGSPNTSQVTIDLVATPTPEPSGAVLASLFLLVSGLAYLRRLRTRICG
jgi:hypothetical protein